MEEVLDHNQEAEQIFRQIETSIRRRRLWLRRVKKQNDKEIF